MKKERLKECLQREVDRWAVKSYAELKVELAEVVAYEDEFDGEMVQFEVQLLENRPDYVHVGIAGSDSTMRRSIFPLGASFLVYADGRIDR